MKQNEIAKVAKTYDTNGHAHHPAYGHLRISHITGSGQTFFGSDMYHENAIQFTFRGASMDENGGHIYEEELVLIARMSNLQFAEAITNLNHKPTPVTYEYMRIGPFEKVPDVPNPEMRVEKFKKEFKKDIEGIYNKAAEIQKNILDISDQGKPLGKKDMTNLINQIGFLVGSITNNLPYVMQRAEESVDQMIGEARIEINTIAQRAMKEAGLATPPISLPKASTNAEKK